MLKYTWLLILHQGQATQADSIDDIIGPYSIAHLAKQAAFNYTKRQGKLAFNKTLHDGKPLVWERCNQGLLYITNSKDWQGKDISFRVYRMPNTRYLTRHDRAKYVIEMTIAWASILVWISFLTWLIIQLMGNIS